MIEIEKAGQGHQFAGVALYGEIIEENTSPVQLTVRHAAHDMPLIPLIPLEDGTPDWNEGHTVPDREAVSTDLMYRYLQEIGKRRVFTKEEEVHYAQRAKAGDAQGKKLMIEHNLKLVVLIAKRYVNKGLPLLDLIAEGNLGLIYAIDKFEPERGYRFSTYASWWIRASIDSALQYQGRTIRLPAHVMQRLAEIFEAKNTLEARRNDGRSAKPEEIASAIGGDQEQIRDILAAAAPTISVDEAIETGRNLSLLDQLTAEASDGPEEQLARLQLNRLVRSRVEKLPPKEQFVIRARFGLDDHEPKTFEAIASQMGVTAERVRQIHIKALSTLRRTVSSASNGLPCYRAAGNSTWH